MILTLKELGKAVASLIQTIANSEHLKIILWGGGDKKDNTI